MPAQLSKLCFDSAMRPLYARLRAHAAASLPAPNDEDALQAGLLRAWERRERFSGRLDSLGMPVGDAFYFFLLKEVGYAALDLRRELSQRAEHLIPSEDILELLPGVDNDALCTLLLRQRASLARLIADTALTERQEACLLGWVEGESQRAIAEGIGVSQHTVAVHLAAATRALSRAARAEEIDIADAFHDSQEHFVYLAPCSTGSALAREALAAMAKADQRHGARCRRRAN